MIICTVWTASSMRIWPSPFISAFVRLKEDDGLPRMKLIIAVTSAASTVPSPLAPMVMAQ